MKSRTIERSLPEQVFISVQNDTATTMSTGHAVLWNYQTNTISTSSYVAGNGYGVTFPRTVVTTPHAVGHFGGVVAIRDIQGGDFGLIQCFGEVPYVIVSGASAAPYFGTAISTIFDDTSASTILLRPLGLYGVSTGAITTGGYLGVITQITSLTNIGTVTTFDYRPFWHGGYCVPLGPTMVATGVSGTGTFTSTVTVKAFVRCLG